MKPIVTEKAVMMIEKDNVLTFEVDKKLTKTEVKKEIEEIFEVKVKSVKIVNKQGKKYAYVKLKKEFLAMDLATKLGII